MTLHPPDRNPVKRWFFLCLAFAAGLSCSLRAQASLYLQDGFNYTPGGALAGNGAWVNSYSLIAVGNGSLIYSGLTDTSPPGNDAAVAANPNAGTSPSPFFTSSPFGTTPSSGVVYPAFLLNYTDMTAPANYTFMGMLPAAGNGGTFSNANDPCDLAEKSNANGTGYTLGIRTYGQGASYAAPVLALNTVNLIVMKYDFAAKTAFLFINPPLGAGEPVTPDASSTGPTAAANLGQIYLRAAGNIAGGGGVASPPYLVDTIRVASTWAEAMPPAPVPPATRLAFTTTPLAGTAGALLARVVVQALDANTNKVATNNVPVTLSLNTGSFAGGTTTAYSDATGKAAFSNMVVDVPGTYTITASASGIGAGLAPGTSSLFEIGPTNAISDEGQALSALLDSFQVEKYWTRGVSVNWLTGAAGGSGPNMTVGTASHCSALVPAVGYVLGVYLLRPPDKSDLNLANNQADWLRTNAAGWYGIASMTYAQYLANTGTLVVASYKDTSGSGHIAIVRPSTRSDADIQAFGPQECQSGVNNYSSTNVMAGFDQHAYAFPDGILYYGHAYTSPIARINPVLEPQGFSNNVFCASAITIVGRKYRLQCSADLTTWSNALAFTNSNNSSNFFCVKPLTDSPGASSPRRFYRLLAQ
jgi:hypothetical protein